MSELLSNPNGAENIVNIIRIILAALIAGGGTYLISLVHKSLKPKKTSWHWTDNVHDSRTRSRAEVTKSSGPRH